MPRRDRKEETAMRDKIRKTILPVILTVALAATAVVVPVSIKAFEAPQPDTGAVGEVSNGGEWTIYSSRTGTAKSGGAISDAAGSGTVEVTKNAELSAAFQFDMATKESSPAADGGRVVKRAMLRLTPMVSKANASQMLYRIDDTFTTAEGRIPITDFAVPRRSKDDFFSDESVMALTPEEITEYPAELAAWQTGLDVTGDVAASDEKLSFQIDYNSGNTNKTEYATTNIDANGRLNGGKVLLYNGGNTDYSKWIYPQIVLEYTDQPAYQNAYADFTRACAQVEGDVVSEQHAVSPGEAQNGSDITLEMYDSTESPIRVDGTSLVLDDQYAGNADSAFVRLTVTNTDGAETARYTRVLSVRAEYTRANTITFDVAKNPKGELSVTSGKTVYTDGTAYAKEGGLFYVNGGANAGYEAEITVTKEGDGDEPVLPNGDGSYTMPDCNVRVSAQYSKKTYGTTRIAAINSVSIKGDGGVQGNNSSAPNLVIGAGRLTFVKFDLSGYDPDVMSKAEINFSGWNTPNTKAVFYVPNNNWDEGNFSSGFCIDGTEDTRISAYHYTKEDGSDATISLLNGTGREALIVPGAPDTTSARDGILGQYYIGASGTSTSDNFDVTDAIRTAMAKSSDGTFSLLVYSPGSGRDAYSVQYAASLSMRPSLVITESSASLPDEAIVTEIKTVRDLETFAEIVNGGYDYAGKTVTLADDIDLSETYYEGGRSWTAIGTQDIGGVRPFAGTFEGNERSITGLYVNRDAVTLGLFGNVSGGVRNLTVEGEIRGNSIAGGIAASCSGRITSCHSRVNIHVQREAGGIAGTVSAGGVIEDCDNAGTITIENKETYAGGIAAHCINAEIVGCANTGRIENGTDGFRNKIGGIVGYLDNSELRYSQNTGDVDSVAETTSYIADETQNYVGGVVGYSTYGVITNCGNSGAVHNAVDYVGGVAGLLLTGDTMSDCSNSGRVSGKDNVGGIVGSNECSDIYDCRNDGAVSGGGSRVGGIAGYLSVGTLNHSTYDELVNSGIEAVGYNSAGTVTEEEDPDAPSVEYRLGDVNNDGELTLQDAVQALQICVSDPLKDEKKQQPYLSADVDRNHVVTAGDVLMILQKVNGKDVPGVDWMASVPVEE